MEKFFEIVSEIWELAKGKIKKTRIARLRKKYQPDSPILGYKILEIEGFQWTSLNGPNREEVEKAYQKLIDLCAKHELNIVIYN